MERLATLEHCDVTDLEGTFDPLYEYFDPDALDTLVTGDPSITFTLSFAQYTIQIDGSFVTIWAD